MIVRFLMLNLKKTIKAFSLLPLKKKNNLPDNDKFLHVPHDVECAFHSLMGNNVLFQPKFDFREEVKITENPSSATVFCLAKFSQEKFHW